MRELLVDLYPRVARSNIIEHRAHLGKPIGIFVKHNVTLVFNELRKRLFIVVQTTTRSVYLAFLVNTVHLGPAARGTIRAHTGG
jgi:hypothetical protein